MAPPTILAHKTDFLTSQTLQLSRALTPTNAWRASNSNNHGKHRQTNNESENAPQQPPPLPEQAVDDALYRLNHTLQQHARRVYAPQATRHVAEQIEALYLEAGERIVRGDGSSEEDEDEDDEDGGGGAGREEEEEGRRWGRGRLRVGVDFTTDDAIASLPPTWDQHPNATKAAQAEAHPPEARRYEDLAAQLAALSERRREARERVARLRGMRDLLAPFASKPSASADNETESEEGPGELVQPNLVTRNGEVEKELERMRVLLVRVAGRVARLPPDGGRRRGDNGRKRKGRDREESGDEAMVADVQDLDVLEKRKVERLLDGF